MNRDAGLWRDLSAPAPGTPQHRFATMMRGLDVSTMHPLALLLLRSDVDPGRVDRALAAIESYLLRRLLRGLSAKTYSQLAARLVSRAREDLGVADEIIVDELLSSQTDTYRWPTDQEMRQHLAGHVLYNWLGQKRIVFVLSAIELSLPTETTEAIPELPGGLEVEHIMPRSWRTGWPLPDPADEQAGAERDGRLDLPGNLTLVTKQMNVSLSNDSWPSKRAKLVDSLLALNRELRAIDPWDDDAIVARGELLTNRILALWPGPQTFMPPDWTPPQAESWAEHAVIEPHEVRRIRNEASPYLASLLDDLAAHPDQRRRYADVEISLGWPRGRLASVLGGYANAFRSLDGRRPWHLHLDGDGVWWIWADAESARLIRTAAAD